MSIEPSQNEQSGHSQHTTDTKKQVTFGIKQSLSHQMLSFFYEMNQ